MHRLTILSLVFILFVTGCSHELASINADISRESDYSIMRATKSGGDFSETAPKTGIQRQESRADMSVQLPDLDPAEQGRLVVYNAVINVVVERIYDSIVIIQNAIEEMGGYMQEMKSDSITLKVPADKFQAAIAEAEKLGEVTKRDIKGTDVTEEMRDLNIRLQNAEQSRDRMIAILEKAETVEDTLKIEKELERITETIELLKGKISYLQNKISFSTLTIKFNSPVPQIKSSFPIPFYWVQNLSSELTRPVRINPTKDSFLGIFEQTHFKLPDSYIKYYEHDYCTRAMSADGIIISQYKEKNYKGGDIEFWSSLVRRELVEQKTIHLTEEDEIKLDNKKAAFLFVGTKQIGSKQYGYLAAISPKKDSVYIFEAWGQLDDFQKDEDKLKKAVKSMKLN